MNKGDKVINKLRLHQFSKSYIIYSILIFVSCAGSHSNSTADKEFQELPIIKINPPPNSLPTLFLSEIADSIHYVALETNKNCLISIGYGYSLDSGFVFIQGLLFFSPEGKFLNSIGRIGQGPEDYIPASGTVVDGKNGIIYVKNRGDIKTFVKYFLSGKYIGTVKKSVSSKYRILWYIIR